MTDPEHTQTTPQPGEKKRWLDDRENVDKIYWGVIGVCALLMLIEPFYHKHPYLGFDGSFGFYGWFGFLACAGLIIVARQLGKIVNRREDFYDAADSDAEDNG